MKRDRFKMTPHDWKKISHQRTDRGHGTHKIVNSTYRCKRCNAKVTKNHKTEYQEAESMEDAMKRKRVPEDCDECVVKQIMEM